MCEHDIVDVTCVGDTYTMGFCTNCGARFAGLPNRGEWRPTPRSAWRQIPKPDEEIMLMQNGKLVVANHL
jgi:hypothetical protein